jgi:hypothetical protein
VLSAQEEGKAEEGREEPCAVLAFVDTLAIFIGGFIKT